MSSYPIQVLSRSQSSTCMNLSYANIEYLSSSELIRGHTIGFPYKKLAGLYHIVKDNISDDAISKFNKFLLIMSFHDQI